MHTRTQAGALTRDASAPPGPKRLRLEFRQQLTTEEAQLCERNGSRHDQAPMLCWPAGVPVKRRQIHQLREGVRARHILVLGR